MALGMMGTAQAKWYNAVVHYKNGQTLECQAEDLSHNSKNVKIRRFANSKAETIEKDSVVLVEVVLSENSERAWLNTPYVKMGKASKGDYSSKKDNRFFPIIKPGYLTMTYHQIPAGHDVADVVLLKRKDLDFGIELIPTHNNAQLLLTWRQTYKAIQHYLEDFPELAQSLEGKKLMVDDIKNLVDEYNQWAKTNKGK